MSDSVPAMGALGETASPAETVIRDAPPDEQPPPVNGRYVIVRDPPSFDGNAALLGEKRALARSESTALLWKNKRGHEVVYPVSGCLVRGGQRDATWLPEGWTMDVFPTGWTLAHLEQWFRYAMNVAGPDTLTSNRGDIPQGSDTSLSYWPTARGLVAHAYLIVRTLGLPGSPTEPRGPMDRAGCLAELRDLLQFFRGTLAPCVPGEAERRVDEEKQPVVESDEKLTDSRSAPRQASPETVKEIAPSTSGFEFRRRSGMFYIRGLGEEGFFPADLIGFKQLAMLLKRPGEGVPMVQLIACGDNNDSRVKADRKRSAQPVFDGQALMDMGNTLKKLMEDRNHADENEHAEEHEKLSNEIAELTEQIQATMTKTGKPKNLNSVLNRLRPRIVGTLKTAYQKMREAHPPLLKLSAHFENTISAESSFFVYRPLSGLNIDWNL